MEWTDDDEDEDEDQLDEMPETYEELEYLWKDVNPVLEPEKLPSRRVQERIRLVTQILAAICITLTVLFFGALFCNKL